MPSSNDPSLLSATALADAIGSGGLSPIAVTEAFLDRIAAQDQRLHAYIAVYADEARLAAEAADKAIRSGHRIGPLHGVPIALKDLIDLEGRITTGGSAAWRQRRSPGTATLAKRLIAAGMIVLGKTHTVEFAMGGWGTNHHMGTPWNPWDTGTARTPGGSSSGSGVAVASAMAPWAIGTDTGGSVRLPASWCGLSGLKTTVGRVSCHGILPLAPSLDTPGPMARSVEDAALLFSVMQGADPLDRLTLSAPPPADPFPTLRRGIKGLRFARMPQRCWRPMTAHWKRWRGTGPKLPMWRCRSPLPTPPRRRGGSSAPRRTGSPARWSMTPRCRSIQRCGRASSSAATSARTNTSPRSWSGTG